MQLRYALGLIALLMAGCDSSSSPSNIDDALVSEDAGVLVDARIEPDAMSALDARVITDAASVRDAVVDRDQDMVDSEASDEGISDSSAADVSSADMGSMFDPVPPCGDDLQVVCGVVRPEIPQQPPVQGQGLNPSEMGPYEVDRIETSVPAAGGGSIPVSIFSPRGVMEPVPLVLALPGHGASYERYPFMTEHLASHGFVVVGADVAGGGLMEPAEHDLKTAKVLAVLDWALRDSAAAERIDAERVAAMGHSLGGKLSFYAASLDDRIDIVVAWDPQNSGGPPCFLGDTPQGSCNDFPVAPNCVAEESGIIHQMRAESLTFGAEDRFITPDTHMWADNFYRGAPSPAHFVSMPTVGHAAWFTDNGVTRLTRGVHTALLLTRLKGMMGLDAWLPGGEQLESGADVARVLSK